MEETELYQLRWDVQEHFEQVYGHPLRCEFLEFQPLANGKVLFDVKITKEQTPLGRYYGFTGYRNQQFFITKLAHQNASPA